MTLTPTLAQILIEQENGLTQEQAEYLALIFIGSKPEGDNEERTIKAVTLLERMLTDAQADVILISILLSGHATFDLSKDETDLIFKITDKGQSAVDVMTLFDDAKSNGRVH